MDNKEQLALKGTELEDNPEVRAFDGRRVRVRQGDILRLVDFGQQVGSEQSGVRPAIVVSNNVCNKVSHTITVVPITAVLKKKHIPTHVQIDSQKYKLKHESLVLCEQIRTLDKLNIREGVISSLDDDDYNAVSKAIMVQIMELDSKVIKKCST